VPARALIARPEGAVVPARTTRVAPGGALSHASAVVALVVGLVVALAVFSTGASSSAAVPAQPAGPHPASPGGQGPWASTLAAGHVPDVSGEAREDPANGEVPDLPERPEAAVTDVFATVGNLELHALSDAVRLHGFHQASTPGSRAMTPVGDRHRVLPSRGRGSPATSAVDVVLVDDEPVVSPVSGTVVENDRYRLYGRTADRRLRIRSAEHPHLEVVLLHVADVRVEVGDEVAGGETVLAGGARKLPFTSQVDAETAPRVWPHVHLEVKKRD
jgi:biotin carboxyl carrier protein